MTTRPPFTPKRPSTPQPCGVATASPRPPRASPPPSVVVTDEPPFADLARRLTEALRPAYVAGDFYSRARSETDTTGRNPVVDVTFERVTIDGEGRTHYAVRPRPGLDKRGMAQVRRRSAAWAAKPEAWVVTERDDGSYGLARRMSLYDLRVLVKEHLSEEDAEELPITFASPIHTDRPLSLWAMRLIASKIVRRQLGEIKIPVLRDLIESLPGWKWSEAMVARPVRWDSHDDIRALEKVFAPQALGVHGHAGGFYVYAGRVAPPLNDNDEALWRHVVTQVTEPLPEDHPVPGLDRGTFLAYGTTRGRDDSYYRDGRPVLRVQKLWRATFARVVTAPNGDTYALYQYRPHVQKGRDPERSYDEGFWTWAYRHGLGDLAEGVLAGTDPVMLRRALSTTVTDLTNTGECQYCTRVQKLDRRPTTQVQGQPVMVDHGFCYPDSEGFRGGLLGERVGPCRGVGWRPYELAHDLLDIVLVELRDSLASAQSKLRTLHDQRDRRDTPAEVPLRWIDRNHKDVRGRPVVKVQIGPGDDRWPEMMAALILDQESVVRWLTHRVQRTAKRIADWKPRPLYVAPSHGADE